MFKRILKVLSVGLEQGHDSLVLGAWGCGVFGNDSQVIARLFHQGLNKNFKGAYKQVMFAVLDRTSDRHYIEPFEGIFKNR